MLFTIVAPVPSVLPCLVRGAGGADKKIHDKAQRWRLCKCRCTGTRGRCTLARLGGDAAPLSCPGVECTCRPVVFGDCRDAARSGRARPLATSRRAARDLRRCHRQQRLYRRHCQCTTHRASDPLRRQGHLVGGVGCGQRRCWAHARRAERQAADGPGCPVRGPLGRRSVAPVLLQPSPVPAPRQF